jgi:hypothetical protein
MAKVVDLKEASEVTGLAVCELRRGCQNGKYPHFRSGNGGKTSKYLFDLEELQQSIADKMERKDKRVTYAYGNLRVVPE